MTVGIAFKCLKMKYDRKVKKKKEANKPINTSVSCETQQSNYQHRTYKADVKQFRL